MLRALYIVLIIGLPLCACNPASSEGSVVLPTRVAADTRLPAAASTPIPSPSPLLTATSPSLPATLTATPSPVVCSPLQDINLADLPALISNPYHPPVPGSDDPHHGVDLAVRLPGSDVAVAGHAVQAALAGRVVLVVRDRFPYGNALLVETELDERVSSLWQPGGIPTPAPTLAPVSALTCPPVSPQQLDPNRRSLYVLYAHLLEPVEVLVGERLTCGQAFGLVGSSGNALNPHLHFETRVGPSGMQFSSMAHYDNSATPDEMGNYCLWRISGLFQLVDPMFILTAPAQ